ncbi:hypothetical protein V2J09_000830 [Rumex salicifolius]
MEGESDFRHWDELIPDALGLIFKNLQLQEMIQVIPRVCKSWAKAVEGPYCWQRIDIDEWSKQSRPEQLDRMLRTLITRSSGSLRELSVSCVNDDGMFSFIADHAGSLQTLILRRSSISDSIVEQVAPKLSSITMLDLSYCCQISNRALEAIGTNCKSLVSLSRNMHPSSSVDEASHAEEARTIARTMPKLKHLSVAYLTITTPVVLEILSGCLELGSLDVRGCWGVKLDRKLLEDKYPTLRVLGPLVDTSCCYEEWSDCSDDWMEYSDDDDEYYENYDEFWNSGELEFRIYEGIDHWHDYGWPASP